MATALFSEGDEENIKNMSRDELLRLAASMSPAEARKFYDKLRTSGPWSSIQERRDWVNSYQFFAIGLEVQLKNQFND
jgi:hypothetical protein